MAIKPMIGSLLESEDGRKKLLDLFHKAYKVGLVLTALVACVIYFGNHAILMFFGEAYLAAKPILLILSVGCVLDFLFSFSGMFLHYGGHEKKMVWVAIAKLICLIACCPIATYYYSIYGTAISYIAVEISFDLLQYIMCRKYLKLKFFGFF